MCRQSRRKLEQTEPGGYRRTWKYDRRKVTYTDTRGNVSVKEYDAAGHLGRSIEAQGTPDQVIRSFVTGPFGLLASTKIDSVDSQECTVASPCRTLAKFEWDSRGNLLSRTDSARGEERFTYNAFNQVTSPGDANGRAASHVYDVLGRIDYVSVTQGNAQQIAYVDYENDTASGKGIGKLANITRDDYTLGQSKQRTRSEYSYDTYGRLESMKYIMPSETTAGVTQSYALKYGYDVAGRLDTVEYPKLPGQSSPVKLRYGYATATGNNGQLAKIDLVENGAATSIFRIDQTDESNRVMWSTTGDGVSKLTLHDWRGKLSTQYMQRSPNDECAFCEIPGYLHFVYDGEANLTSRIDTAQGATETFAYDHLNRVSAMSMGNINTPWEAGPTTSWATCAPTRIAEPITTTIWLGPRA